MAKTLRRSPDLDAGCVAAITGAGSGIGRALAVALSRRGVRLALADRDAAGLAETLALVGKGVDAFTQTLDVADEAAVNAFAQKTLERFERADAIFNNAGVAIAGTVEELTTEEMTWLWNINFWGVVYGTKAFLPRFLEQKSGTIVNISSLFGLWAPPAQSIYAASKFAVRGFTESLRGELSYVEGGRFAVATVHPGGIKTNIAKRARFAAAADPELTQRQMLAFDSVFLNITPETAAHVIVDGLDAGHDRILIGREVEVFDKLVRTFGGGAVGMVNKYFVSKIPTE